MSTRPPTVIPADEYDTLEFVAEAYGGVGCGKTYEHFPADAPSPDPDSAPYCLLGCAHFAGIVGGTVDDLLGVRPYGLHYYDIDAAINRVRFALPNRPDRAPFAAAVKELNLVRGDV